MQGHGPPPLGHGKRILFLEAYDSFSNNIVSLLKDALGDNVEVHVLHMDMTSPADPEASWSRADFVSRLSSFDAVVCGPGPGTPLDEGDVGAFRLLWALPSDQMVPVLGICLGFQSLVAASGGKIRRLKKGLHGMVRDIEHLDSNGMSRDIFSGVPPFQATLYHSLCADIGQDDIPDEQWHQAKWTPSSTAPDLEPLAWVTESGVQGEERILMAVKRAGRPFWGLQYHPESVCTDPAAHIVLKNWFQQALEWNASERRSRGAWRPGCPSSPEYPAKGASALRGTRPDCGITQKDPFNLHGSRDEYNYRQLELPDGINATHIVDILCPHEEVDREAIVLDSSSVPSGDVLAKNSIIALDVSQALRMEHRVHDDYLTMRAPGPKPWKLRVPLASEPGKHNANDVWHSLTDFWRRNRASLRDEEVPDCVFRGGFMGYVTYEGGLHGLSPSAILGDRRHRRPDVCMVWVTKCVVLDHKKGKTYVQALGPRKATASWLDDIVNKLSNSDSWKRLAGGRRDTTLSHRGRANEDLLRNAEQGNGPLHFKIPNLTAYEDDVRRCQESIKAGDSYELCLTGQTTMARPQHGNRATWDMYKALRTRQPAPFGSYIRLGGATLLTSSPERFLQHDSHGSCSMRPMKGTVRKSAAVPTLADAEKILHCPKEEAENLMIVDLVRHDLHAVCGSGRVAVPELLKVEEYATVFQMITVVTGDLAPPPGETSGAAAGLRALGSMLPPGSMTGAPKKRSCEILGEIEARERSLYSGVVGYFDITGQADWSVTIRAMFRWDDERPAADMAGCAPDDEVWHVGAGGAVTILSTPEGEREEMLTKLCGPLSVFMDAA